MAVFRRLCRRGPASARRAREEFLQAVLPDDPSAEEPEARRLQGFRDRLTQGEGAREDTACRARPAVCASLSKGLSPEGQGVHALMHGRDAEPRAARRQLRWRRGEGEEVLPRMAPVSLRPFDVPCRLDRREQRLVRPAAARNRLPARRRVGLQHGAVVRAELRRAHEVRASSQRRSAARSTRRSSATRRSAAGTATSRGRRS